MTFLSDSVIARLKDAAAPPAAHPAPPSPDRYRLGEEIGRGGMGTIYRAVDTVLDREVAIKVPNAADHHDLERRLQIEAHVLARLEHPGIVPIHDAGRLADGRPFYVMKVVRGHTLPAYMAGEPAEAERLRVFERICETMSFAHANGVIHRDLKPENIMVGAFGEVMVMDWGAAKVEELDVADRVERPASPDAAGTAAGTVIGTRGFMAPEQASGSRSVDPRTDVFGLGGLLFFMLTGRVASRGAAAATAASGVSKPLRAVCATALAFDPAARYSSAAALAEDLARYRSGLPVAAFREGLLDRTRRVGRTYRAAILLVLAYVVMRAVVAFTARW
jgi:serine/threonine protein kinase